MSKDKTEQSLPIGAHVEAPHLKRRGLITSGPNNRGEYAVQMGAMLIWIKEAQLRQLSGRQEANKIENTGKRKERFRQKRYPGSSSSNCPRIDLHGYTQQQALEKLEITLDKALLNGADSIEIIHGLGSGKLQACVERYLSESIHVANFQLVPNNPGTTIAYLK